MNCPQHRQSKSKIVQSLVQRHLPSQLWSPHTKAHLNESHKAIKSRGVAGARLPQDTNTNTNLGLVSHAAPISPSTLCVTVAALPNICTTGSAERGSEARNVKEMMLVSVATVDKTALLEAIETNERDGLMVSVASKKKNNNIWHEKGAMRTCQSGYSSSNCTSDFKTTSNKRLQSNGTRPGSQSVDSARQAKRHVFLSIATLTTKRAPSTGSSCVYWLTQ